MVGRSKASVNPLVMVWLFFLIFFPLMVKLGFWQLDRAEQKRSLLEEQELRASVAPRDFIAGEPVGRFERLIMSGHYQDFHLLLDNRQNKARVGYELLTLFTSRNGERFLVNRGWVPAPKYRSEFPKVNMPSSADGSVTLEGYFYWPDKKLSVLESTAEEGIKNVWRVQGLDWPLIEQLFSSKFAVEKEFRLLSDGITGAENIYWDYQMMNPAKHQGYALQWFSMSFALLLLACFTTYKLRRDRH